MRVTQARCLPHLRWSFCDTPEAPVSFSLGVREITMAACPFGATVTLSLSTEKPCCNKPLLCQPCWHGH